MESIKHLWFDFSDTLAFINAETHEKVRYIAYSEVTGKPITPELIAEYKALFEKYKSHALIFSSLGKSSNYWSERINASDPASLYTLADKNIPHVLHELRQIVPISVFSNIQLQTLLPALGIDIQEFTHILSSGMFAKPKPALDGFYKIIELSELPAEQILYVGDSVTKDIAPAKQVGLRTGLVWSESPEADFSFKNFDEILSFFKP